MEQQQWEREIFFQPRLVELERRTAPRHRAAGLLLALVAVLVACSTAFAQEADSGVSPSTEQASDSETLADWWLDFFGTGGEEETPTSTMKNGDDRDPDEGDPK
jgi:hypothetical protein